MKFAPVLVAVATLFAAAAFAQKAPAPAAAPAATVKAVCKDGTPFEGETLRGACRGHGGVNKAAPAKPAIPATPATPAAAAKPAAAAGQVWANQGSKVYHCQGDRFYGKTKKGAYMSEANAKAKGLRAARGKACAA